MIYFQMFTTFGYKSLKNSDYIEYMLDVYGIWILLREIFKCPCSVSEYAYICQYACPEMSIVYLSICVT